MTTENITISKQGLLKAYREAEPSQKEKYYIVDTQTGDTLLSGDDKERLEECCFGDDMIVTEEEWHKNWEHVEPSYEL